MGKKRSAQPESILDAHPSNEANGGNMFRKVDLSKSAKLDMDSEFEVVDALSLLRSKPCLISVAVATAFRNENRTPSRRDQARLAHLC